MAPEIVTLDQVKFQLRLDPSADDEDADLNDLVSSALRAIENETGHDIAETWPSLKEKDKVVANRAVLMLVAYWYNNRGESGKGVGDIPPGLEWLLYPLKRWVC